MDDYVLAKWRCIEKVTCEAYPENIFASPKIIGTEKLNQINKTHVILLTNELSIIVVELK